MHLSDCRGTARASHCSRASGTACRQRYRGLSIFSRGPGLAGTAQLPCPSIFGQEGVSQPGAAEQPSRGGAPQRLEQTCYDHQCRCSDGYSLPGPQPERWIFSAGLDLQADATAATCSPALNPAGSDSLCQSERSPIDASAAGTSEGNKQMELVKAAPDGEMVRDGLPGRRYPSEGRPGSSGVPIFIAPGETSAAERPGEGSPGQKSSLAAPEVHLAVSGVAEGSPLQDSAPMAPAATPARKRAAEGPFSKQSSAKAFAVTAMAESADEDHLEQEGECTAAKGSPAADRRAEKSPKWMSSPIAAGVSTSKGGLPEETPREKTHPTVVGTAPGEDRLAKDPLNRKSAHKEGLIAMLLSATSGKHARGKQTATLGGKEV